MLATAIWTALSFLAGSLPFSYWLGKLALHEDIRDYGDTNPGATNVLRAGGWAWGGAALLLDYLKGALPVGLAYFAFGMQDWRIVPITLAAPLGHAFSPFLRFRGGKAVAATAGIWSGLTLWEAPTVGGLLLAVWYAIVDVDGWAVMLMVVSFLIYLLLTRDVPAPWLAIWAGNTLLLAWTHREDLSQPPGLRPWIARRLGEQR